MPTLLITDDEIFIQTVYADGFKDRGYRVLQASDGQQALDLVHQTPPDIILLDLIMPKKSGFQVLKVLHADPQLAKIPVLVLSNLSQPTDEKEVKRLGAKAFIIKSNISFSALFDLVEATLGRGGKPA